MPRRSATSSAGVSPSVAMPSISAYVRPASATAADTDSLVSSLPETPVFRPMREMPIPEMIACCSGTSVTGADPRSSGRGTWSARDLHRLEFGADGDRGDRRPDQPDPSVSHAGEPRVLDRGRRGQAADPAVRRLRSLGAPACRDVSRGRFAARTGGRERQGIGVHVHDQPASLQSLGAAAIRDRDRRARGAGRPAPHDECRQSRPRAGRDRDARTRRVRGARRDLRAAVRARRGAARERVTVALLDGKVAIVTGAGHGVGRGHALDLAAAGARVVVNDLGGSARGDGADAGPAAEVVSIIRERGGEAVANFDDVSSFDGARNMVQQAVDEFGQLDILVNNAGILRDRMIFNMAEGDWDAVVQVHLKGHFAPSRHACEDWRDRSKQIAGPVNASIICTTSLVGLIGNVGQTNYAAAKGGIAVLTIALALEMERYGVRANCVAPSGTTRLITMTQGSDEPPLEADEYTEWNARDPGNVAPLVTWLASDLSRHVTGQVFFSFGETIKHHQPWTPNVT